MLDRNGEIGRPGGEFDTVVATGMGVKIIVLMTRRYNQNMGPTRHKRLPFVWDYDLDEKQFRAILDGQQSMGRLNQDWAARRLLEYASYDEIIRMLGYRRLVENWPRWRSKIRSESRRRGFDFLVKWLPEKHPEFCRD